MVLLLVILKYDMNLREITKKYFYELNNKMLDQMQNILSNDCILTSWEGEKQGKKEVINEIINLFEANLKFYVYDCGIFVDEDSSTVVVEFTVRSSTEEIDIVDVIKFNKDEKIFSIRAYKG